MNATLTFLRNLFPVCCHDRIALVGGCVRDFLLGKENRDIDLVAALTHGELTGLGFRLVEAGSAATIYFKHHHLFGKIEVTQLKSMTDLDEDLRRRDFTINAMAMDMAGAHIDPLGGKNDLEAGRLHACSEHSFSGDPLRIFRAFRFEAYGWRMTTGTVSLIREQDWSTAFRAMPMERFSLEMVKSLTSQKPERFFELMMEFNLGAEFLPELFLMPKIPAGPIEHHPEGDLFIHSIQVLQRAVTKSDDPLARFCALFHDIGKLATDPALYPKHHGHDETGFKMAEEFCNRLRLPATFRRALSWTSRLHGKAGKWTELRDSTKVKMAEQAIKAGIVQILPLVCAADKPDNLPMANWDLAVKVAGMTTKELGIDPARLEAMPVEGRQSFIMQKRVETLRDLTGQ